MAKPATHTLERLDVKLNHSDRFNHYLWPIWMISLCATQILKLAYMHTIAFIKPCIFSWGGGGGRRSPAVACWASDHWVASSNPLRGKFRH